MPQTLSETWRSDLGHDAERIHSTWLHTPGNLTLTGFNPELSNKPFSEKRKEYHQSNIMMTRQVSEFETWGEAEIRQRGEAMAQVAAKTWPGPAVPVQRIEQDSKTANPRSDLLLRYWMGFREHLKARRRCLVAGAGSRPYYNLRLRSTLPQDHLLCTLTSHRSANKLP